MATGDVTIWTGTVTTATVYFQPSAGVQMALKCCMGTWLSTTNYISLLNPTGGDFRGSDALYPYRAGLGSNWSGGSKDQLEVNGTLLLTNGQYVYIDGTGSSGKQYYAAGIQTD